MATLREERYRPPEGSGAAGAEHKERKKDVRSAFRRDRDRVLYSPAFRRLAGITQVVAPHQGQALHNRLIHSIKAGQVARSIAESLLARNSPDSCRMELVDYLDPDVAEFAGLAHDLGHPPFGHAAEAELQQILKSSSTDSFEGNAQTFRIVTRLARRGDDSAGLSLTRASLRSVLKYPWPRMTGDPKASRKWGFYLGDKAAYTWATAGSGMEGEWWAGSFTKKPIPSLEAQIMDWADDIAFAIHDLEDFVRVGAIPLIQIWSQDRDWEEFSLWLSKRWSIEGRDAHKALRCANAFLHEHFPDIPKNGDIDISSALMRFTGSAVHACISSSRVKFVTAGMDRVRCSQ
jgi:dGTPase